MGSNGSLGSRLSLSASASAPLGLVLGRGLGIRMRKDDPAFVQAPVTWRAKAIVLAVLSEPGFQGVEISSLTRFARFHDWGFVVTGCNGAGPVGSGCSS